MRKLVLILSFMVLFILFANINHSGAQGDDCSSLVRGNFPHLGSIEVEFTCSNAQPVYFGVCDSGNVPDDDLFNFIYMGSVVSSNSYVGDVEYVDIGTANAAAGTNSAQINSLVDTPFPPATYSYAISPERSAVSGYLEQWCGTDFGGTAPGCLRSVPVFTEDTAPTDGTIRVDVQYGAMNREEGWTVQTWELGAGQRVNNAPAAVHAPKYVRVWWQPVGSSTWHLLPSQYWRGDGTLASEYGVSCDDKGVPSYHTSFGTAIPSDQVPAVPSLN